MSIFSNSIADSILQACVQKVDEAIYELESLTQTGNVNSTPEYTLSMVEKAVNNATDFATVYNLYLGSEAGGDHVDVIKAANEFAQSLSDVLINTKGVTRLAIDDDASDKLIGIAKAAGDVGLRFFLNLQSYKLDLLQPNQRKDVATRNNSEIRGALSKLSEGVEALMPKGKSLPGANGNIDDTRCPVQLERLSLLLNVSRNSCPVPRTHFGAVDLHVHDSILQAAMAITNAIGRLIKAAADNQQEIVAEGRGSSSVQQFYKRNNRWTEGLISAAKAVAFSTTVLIESADGVLSGTHSWEQLIVASNGVAAATAQLVAASRVKSNLMSKTQERLEAAARAVTDACKALVRQVRAISAKETEEEMPDWSKVPVLEFKKREMEQQVEILKLEKELGAARHRLGAMRRAGYHTDETD